MYQLNIIIIEELDKVADYLILGAMIVGLTYFIYNFY
jgi:hypothetical protein